MLICLSFFPSYQAVNACPLFAFVSTFTVPYIHSTNKLVTIIVIIWDPYKKMQYAVLIASLAIGAIASPQPMITPAPKAHDIQKRFDLPASSGSSALDDVYTVGLGRLVRWWDGHVRPCEKIAPFFQVSTPTTVTLQRFRTSLCPTSTLCARRTPALMITARSPRRTMIMMVGAMELTAFAKSIACSACSRLGRLSGGGFKSVASRQRATRPGCGVSRTFDLILLHHSFSFVHLLDAFKCT